MNKTMMGCALRLKEVFVRTQTLLARQHLAVVEASMEAGTKHWQAIIETKYTAGLIARQADVVAELGERLIATTQEILDIQVQVQDEWVQCMEDSFKAVQSKPRLKYAVKQLA